MADPFISEQNVVDFLGRGDASDPGLTIAIGSACDIVRLISEQDLDEDTDSPLTLDGTGTDCLLLPQLPVSSVTSVQVDGTAVTDYVLKSDGTLIRTMDTEADTPSTATWPEGRQNVEIQYTHGYPSGDIPRPLKQVALQLAARMYEQGNAMKESIGEVSRDYAASAMELTNGEKAILRKIRPR